MTVQDFEKMESQGLIKQGSCLMLSGSVNIEGIYKGIDHEGIILSPYSGGVFSSVIDVSKIDIVFKSKRAIKPGQKQRSYEMINTVK